VCREIIARVELCLKFTHVIGNFLGIGVIWISIQHRISGRVESCNPGFDKWKITSIFDLFKCSDSGNTVSRQTKDVPAASDTMSRGIANTTDIRWMRATSTGTELARGRGFSSESTARGGRGSVRDNTVTSGRAATLLVTMM
jgi:hypothetical protein